jgi:hypothetical protein
VPLFDKLPTVVNCLPIAKPPPAINFCSHMMIPAGSAGSHVAGGLGVVSTPLAPFAARAFTCCDAINRRMINKSMHFEKRHTVRLHAC